MLVSTYSVEMMHSHSVDMIHSHKNLTLLKSVIKRQTKLSSASFHSNSLNDNYKFTSGYQIHNVKKQKIGQIKGTVLITLSSLRTPEFNYW